MPGCCAPANKFSPDAPLAADPWFQVPHLATPARPPPALPSLRPRPLQVISPMRKGPAGTTTLNPMLQALLNPPSRGKAELPRHPHAHSAAGGGDSAAAAGGGGAGAGSEGGRVFRVGDRVIQQVNNYDKEVFNGDQGRVSGWGGQAWGGKRWADVAGLMVGGWAGGWVCWRIVFLRGLCCAHPLRLRLRRVRPSSTAAHLHRTPPRAGGGLQPRRAQAGRPLPPPGQERQRRRRAGQPAPLLGEQWVGGWQKPCGIECSLVAWLACGRGGSPAARRWRGGGSAAGLAGGQSRWRGC